MLKKNYNGNEIEGKRLEDIEHVHERIDGSSDGLYEAMDIHHDNGDIECSNWNPDLHQKGELEELFKPEYDDTENYVKVYNEIESKFGKEKASEFVQEYYKLLSEDDIVDVYNIANKCIKKWMSDKKSKL